MVSIGNGSFGAGGAGDESNSSKGGMSSFLGLSEVIFSGGMFLSGGVDRGLSALVMREWNEWVLEGRLTYTGYQADFKIK